MRVYRAEKGLYVSEDVIKDEYDIAVSECGCRDSYAVYLDQVTTAGGYYTPITEGYFDIENDNVLTYEELQAEYAQFRADGVAHEETFEEYLDNCMTRHNGTLERVTK